MAENQREFSVSSSDAYQTWKHANVQLDSPRKVLTAAKTVLADMKISELSAVKCMEYFAAHGYALKLETIRRWYRKNCKTVDDAKAIIRDAHLIERDLPNSLRPIEAEATAISAVSMKTLSEPASRQDLERERAFVFDPSKSAIVEGAKTSGVVEKAEVERKARFDAAKFAIHARSPDVINARLNERMINAATLTPVAR